MNAGFLFCFFFVTTLLFSCGDLKKKQNVEQQRFEVVNGLLPGEDVKVLGVNDYISWVQDPDNGFRKEKNIDDLIYSVQYKPYEYIACMEQRKDELPDTLVKNTIAQIDGMQYYNLKISLTNGGGEFLKYKMESSQQYQERVNYYAFQMQNDIHLVEGNDTIPCELYHFERAYDAAPYASFVLGFALSKNNPDATKTFILHDKTFNKGLLKFTFDKEKLQQLPKLKTL